MPSGNRGLLRYIITVPFLLSLTCSSRVLYGRWVEVGLASWYGPKFHGRRTSSGEIFDMNKLTAAHRTLPFGTLVLVTNLNNGRKVVVKINDRGPLVKGRLIDLSYGAAKRLDMLKTGITKVRIEVIDWNVPLK